MIINHFKAQHRFVEFDYAQLEIRVLALATQDRQLISDINSGMDMHTHFASEIYDKPMADITKSERRMAKGFSFQLQYGAGAPGIAKFWNVRVEMTERFIDSYYGRYPRIAQWQEGNLEFAKSTLRCRGDQGPDEPIPSYFVPVIWRDPETTEPLGFFRLLGDKPPWRKRFSISPTKVKNYPIQGAASDIMMFMLRRVQLALENFENTRLLNTVHDSVLLDVGDNLEEVTTHVKDTLEAVPDCLRDLFRVSCPVDFPVDVAQGNTLAEVKSAA